MVWHRPASQPDLVTPFKQETRFGSQINGTTQESKPAEKHLDETTPKPSKYQFYFSKVPRNINKACYYID